MVEVVGLRDGSQLLRGVVGLCFERVHKVGAGAGRHRANWLGYLDSDAGSTGGSRSSSPLRKHAYQRTCRRAFRSLGCGWIRPPTERKSEALHGHGDEEREVK